MILILVSETLLSFGRLQRLSANGVLFSSQFGYWEKLNCQIVMVFAPSYFFGCLVEILISFVNYGNLNQKLLASQRCCFSVTN